jgi:hypothetical protein
MIAEKAKRGKAQKEKSVSHAISGRVYAFSSAYKRHYESDPTVF